MVTGKSLLSAAVKINALLIFCGLSFVVAWAQQPPPGQAQPRPAPPAAATPSPTPPAVSPEAADLAITANVTARELRFEVVPNPTVEFTGSPKRETVWDAERQNLPRPVQPGVTYRDIGIRLRITSIFADIDRIVAEALGEVPMSDDAPPPQMPSAPPPQGQPPAPKGEQVKLPPVSPNLPSLVTPEPSRKATRKGTTRRGTRK
jgi:hypothetical protein